MALDQAEKYLRKAASANSKSAAPFMAWLLCRAARRIWTRLWFFTKRPQPLKRRQDPVRNWPCHMEKGEHTEALIISPARLEKSSAICGPELHGCASLSDNQVDKTISMLESALEPVRERSCTRKHWPLPDFPWPPERSPRASGIVPCSNPPSECERNF